MRTLQNILILLWVGMPAILWADISQGDLPPDAKWYVQVDFEQMRSSEAGRPLYAWLQSEAFKDIREDAGVDLDKEADRITAFASNDGRLTVLVEGNISQQTQDKIMGMGAATGAMDKFGSGDKTYYYVKNGSDTEGEPEEVSYKGSELGADALANGGYFSFALKNKVIVTSSEADMKSLLDSKGKVARGPQRDGALLVLSAERSLLQAGLNTDDIGTEIGWDSNLLRNTEQAAVVIADEGGKVALEAQLVTTEKAMAESLASIVRGLISLQVFNDDLDPAIAAFLQSTTVDVDGGRLRVKVALDPKVVVDALN